LHERNTKAVLDESDQFGERRLKYYLTI